MSRAFIDTNVLVYAFDVDVRQGPARAILTAGGTISVQSLNEFAHVTRRKLGFKWPEVREGIAALRSYCPDVVDLDVGIHEQGLRLAEQYRLSIYDGMIVAAALAAGCDVLYSEDMHHGLVIDGVLRIENPFA